jgi:hypothetical protein
MVSFLLFMEATLNPCDMLYLLHEHVTLVQLSTMLTLEWVILTRNLFLDVSNVSQCGISTCYYF